MMTAYQHLINLKSRLGRFVRHIAVDTRGNTLVIIGAALIPLMAMIGSGIDMSRAYMTKARLQQACDSGAIAGRAAMTTVVLTDTAKAQANKYFDFNFPTAAFGSNTPVRTYTADSEGQVTGNASAKLPTGVMQLFGIKSLDLEVTCKAKLDFVNTDVVLVLDTTGSMASTISTGETRLAALQAAAMDLYTTLEPIGKNLYNRNLRLRYGIIPYSQNVNIGKLLYARSPNYIRNPFTYYECTGGYNSNRECISATLRTSAVKPASWFTDTWKGCITNRATSNAITSSTTTIPDTAKDMDIDLLPTSADSTTQWQPADPSVDNSSERQTTTALTKSFVSCPAPSADLKEYYNAPESTTERTKFQTIINSLDPNDSTYHDVGMIWGAQMIAPEQGVFNVPLPGESGPNRNPKSYNNIAVNKHLIFMTDGIMDTSGASIDRYTMYGTERFSKATYTGTSDSELVARHRQRFALMCEAVKKMGVTVWVVQFEEDGDDTLLPNCATDAAHFSKVGGSSDLSDEFIKIGKAIGALRITK